MGKGHGKKRLAARSTIIC